MAAERLAAQAGLLLVLVLILGACDKGGGENSDGQGTVTEGEGTTSEGEAAAPDEPREPVTLTLWHSYRGDELDSLNQIVERFNNTHDDTTIEALAIPFDAYPDRITAAIPRGRGPDFFIFAHDRVGDWADEGVIESINYWTDDALLDLFFENTVQALVYRRGLYGLPLAFKSVVLFYNPELVPNPPTTTDELIEIASSLTSTEGEGRYGLVYQYSLLYFHAWLLYGYGGGVMDDEGNLTLTDPGSVASVAFAQSLYQEHHLLPENAFSQTVVSLFNDRRAAMVISGPWFRGELLDDTPWSVAMLPRISANGQPAHPFFSSEAIMLSAHGENKERAFEAARWLATDAQAARNRMDVGHMPVALRSAYQDEVDATMQVFRQQVGDAVPMPNIPLMRRVWGHADTALFNAIKNNADPAEALATAQQRILAE